MQQLTLRDTDILVVKNLQGKFAEEDKLKELLNAAIQAVKDKKGPQLVSWHNTIDFDVITVSSGPQVGVLR